MSIRAGKRLPEEVDGQLEGAPYGPTHPTSTNGGRHVVREGSSRTMEPTSVNVNDVCVSVLVTELTLFRLSYLNCVITSTTV
jgi:hypothetical protein